ncbi:DUF6087 family protein [Streptomyces sp. NPDC006290]|uniref:DUF6087 family protein n=1 Tax=Streptomyces sp. NPDC006290 TaxID=3156745 RepID=UPI0033A3FDDD
MTNADAPRVIERWNGHSWEPYGFAVSSDEAKRLLYPDAAGAPEPPKGLAPSFSAAETIGIASRRPAVGRPDCPIPAPFIRSPPADGRGLACSSLSTPPRSAGQ